MKEGYGAHLLTKPETIRDMVLQVRNRVSESFAVSVKIRLLDEDWYFFLSVNSFEIIPLQMVSLIYFKFFFQ